MKLSNLWLLAGLIGFAAGMVLSSFGWLFFAAWALWRSDNAEINEKLTEIKERLPK